MKTENQSNKQGCYVETHLCFKRGRQLIYTVNMLCKILVIFESKEFMDVIYVDLIFFLQSYTVYTDLILKYDGI